MYLKSIHSVNVGPIEDAKIIFPFNDDKSPKPIVIVGENGTGKSVLLSNIVDSFYMIAHSAFNNAMKLDEISTGRQYYKIVTGQEIHFYKNYMYSYIQYEDKNISNKSIEYLFKSGNFSVESFCNAENIKHKYFSWNGIENYKKVKIESKEAENIFNNSVICYFPPDRYERPNWMGNKYYDIKEFEHPSVQERFSGNLYNPILVADITSETLQWLLDVIADSRCDVNYSDESGFNIAHVKKDDTDYYRNLIALGKSRQKIEELMGIILDKEIYFGLNPRSTNSSRFNINLSNGKKFVPTLNALSTGQSALFNMFATIIRYADSNDINKSINLKDITGIVVIDEIELHLHSNLQMEVLPKLLKQFPKVQFIITSHSSLFLLGMDKLFGEDGYEIYQMPYATKITSEQFSEFEKTYKYLADTETHQKEIKEAIQKYQGKTLIVTEGKTDWKHIKHALDVFKSRNEFIDLDIHFLEYEDDSLNDSKLETLLKNLAKISRPNKIIGIFDNDTSTGFKYLEPQYLENNIYACSIKDTQGYPKGIISIELLYPRQELITAFDKNNRRIYLSDEFTNDSHRLIEDNSIVCTNNSIFEAKKRGIVKVIDDRVFDSDDNNIALSKADFAKYIYDEDSSFSKLSIEGFRQIFEMIKDIINESID